MKPTTTQELAEATARLLGERPPPRPATPDEQRAEWQLGLLEHHELSGGRR
jgi:hypothetical protein